MASIRVQHCLREGGSKGCIAARALLLLAVGFTVLLSTVFLASCSIGRGDPTPAPVSLEAYQPASVSPTPDAAPSNTDAEGDASEVADADTSVRRSRSTELIGSYTAEIVPVDQVPVVPEVSGQVLEFNLNVGDRVRKDDVVLRVESNALEAQRAQALAALEAAQAQLDLLLDEPDEEDVDAARASVAAADEGYKRALEGPTAEDMIMAEAQLRQAEAALRRAQAAYDQVSWNPLIAALPESQQLEAATLSLEAAKAQYDKIVKGSTADIIAAAYAQLAGARAQLKALEDGAKPAQIQAAQAQVHQAETALYLAQLQLDKATLRSPRDGIVSSVSTSVGSMVAPGAPVAVLLSPEIEIIVSVEEARLPDLRVGQPATIRVDAYPERIFGGEVAIIAPTIDPATRTVQVTVRPGDDAEVLVPGMFATVDLQY